MLKNLYLAGIVAVAFGAAVLLPRLVDGDIQSSFLTALLVDPSPKHKQIDRLQVGSPVDPLDISGSR